MNFGRKKLFLIILAVFGAGLAIAIVFLELVGKKYNCSVSRAPSVFSPFQEVQQKLSAAEREKRIADLKSRIATGDKVTKKEFRQAAEDLIMVVDPSVLGRINGIAYGNFGYVRNDLPAAAKKFVQRHELEHLLQTGKEENPEFSANLAAAKEYPWGLLETIFFSLRERANYYDSPLCYISTLWKTFKIYFLP